MVFIGCKISHRLQWLGFRQGCFSKNHWKYGYSCHEERDTKIIVRRCHYYTTGFSPVKLEKRSQCGMKLTEIEIN